MLMTSVLCFAAHVVGEETPTRPHVSMSVAASVEQIAPGRPFDVICTLDVPTGWHIYWKDPGASGAATEITMHMPPGFVSAPTRFPRPKRLPESSGVINALEGRVHFAIRVGPPASLQIGQTIDLAIKADWFVCKKVCFLGAGEVVLNVRVAKEAGKPTSQAALLHGIPQPIGSRDGTSAVVHAGLLRVVGQRDPAGPPGFLPIACPGVSWGTPKASLHENRFVMDVPVSYDQENGLQTPPRIQGLLTFGSLESDPAWVIDLPFGEQSDGETQ
jgi:DsbC/DsbD-like thiol-disulfide interchange protein